MAALLTARGRVDGSRRPRAAEGRDPQEPSRQARRAQLQGSGHQLDLTLPGSRGPQTVHRPGGGPGAGGWP